MQKKKKNIFYQIRNFPKNRVQFYHLSINSDIHNLNLLKSWMVVVQQKLWFCAFLANFLLVVNIVHPKKICDDVSLNVKRLLTLRTPTLFLYKRTLSLSLKFEVQRGRINRFLQLPIYIYSILKNTYVLNTIAMDIYIRNNCIFWKLNDLLTHVWLQTISRRANLT